MSFTFGKTTPVINRIWARFFNRNLNTFGLDPPEFEVARIHNDSGLLTTSKLIFVFLRVSSHRSGARLCNVQSVLSKRKQSHKREHCTL